MRKCRLAISSKSTQDAADIDVALQGDAYWHDRSMSDIPNVKDTIRALSNDASSIGHTGIKCIYNHEIRTKCWNGRRSHIGLTCDAIVSHCALILASLATIYIAHPSTLQNRPSPGRSMPKELLAGSPSLHKTPHSRVSEQTPVPCIINLRSRLRRRVNVIPPPGNVVSHPDLRWWASGLGRRRSSLEGSSNLLVGRQ